MLHELLFALNGFTGDVFQYDGDCIRANKELFQTPLIHPSEFQLLDDILGIATLYKKIEEFIKRREQVTRPKAYKDDDGPCGLYISAVSNGTKEILEKYLEVVCALEQQILDDVYLTMIHVKVKLEPFRGLFHVLLSLIAKIEAQEKSSAAIVEIVKSHYDLNIPYQEDLKLIIPWVNTILYKQITSWVVLGSLFDPYEEFFIQSKCPSEDQESLKSMSRKEVLKASESYIVNFAVLPSHFSVPLADNILFVGDTIGILQKPDRTKLFADSKQKEFFQKMEALPRDTFRTEELEGVIEDLDQAVGKDLHHLVVTETDLQKHLGIIKDFFLLGRGELFHDFLLHLKGMWQTKKTGQLDVKQAFALAAGRVQVQEDILQRIQISIDIPPPKTVLGFVSSYIPLMSLTLENEWPLHKIFTPIAMKNYNEMFVFLLQIRQLQMDLNLLWMNTRKIFCFPIPEGPAELRIVMGHFIDHLHHFLQEDVLGATFAKLTEDIEKSSNFTEIRISHAQFQASILNQSFRAMIGLRHYVDNIVQICNKFVQFMEGKVELWEKEDNERIPNEGISQEVLELSKDFNRHMDLLLTLLKGAAGNAQGGPYLGQFLLRLDFNSYFSSDLARQYSL